MTLRHETHSRVKWNPIEFSQFLTHFIDLRTLVSLLAIFRSSPLSLEEKLRWAFLWRITVAFRCFNFYVKILIFHGVRLKTVSSDFFLRAQNEDLDRWWGMPHHKITLQNHGFCRFWQGRLHFHSFRQNILNPARSSAFFMYTLFLLRSKSSRRNLGFTVENVVENMVIQVL